MSNLKKICLATSMIAATFLLSGCGEKDKAYYLSNIEDAQKKRASCEESIVQAMMAGDEKKLKSLENDAECRAADLAIKENAKIERERQQAEAEKLRQEEEAKKAAEAAQEKSKLVEQYKDVTWQQNIANYANNECSKTSFSTFGGKTKTPICMAWQTFYEEQVDIGKQALDTLTLPEMEAQIGDYCSLDRRTISACTVFSAVYTEKEKKAVEAYVADTEKMKTDYNQCVDEYQKINQSNYSINDKSTLRSNLKLSYPCKQAKEAKIQLGLGYDEFSKKL